MHAPLPKLPAKMPAERSRSRRERRSASARRPVLHVVMPGVEVARAEPRKGETVTAFLRRTGWAHRDRQYGWQFKKGLPTVLEVNGEPLLRKHWSRKKIAANDNIRFVSYPLGGGQNGAKQVIGLVALVALAAFAAPLAGAGLAAAGINASTAVIGTLTAGQLATGALLLGGSLLINALVSPKPGATNNPNATIDQIYTVSAQGNAAKLGQPLPVRYGREKVYPDFAATPWSEFVGNDQYLNVLLSQGMGLFDYEQMFVSDTPFWDSTNGVSASFPSASVAFYEPGDQIDLFPTNVSQSDEVNGQQLPTSGANIGPFIANAAGTKAYQIAVDYVFPAGCFQTNDEGQTVSYSVGIVAERQEVDDAGAPIGSWATLASRTLTFASRSPIRGTLLVGVGEGRWQIRFRRTNGNPSQDKGAADILWAGLRAYLRGDNSFADVSTIAIRIKASESTQGSYKFGVLATRKLPVWDSGNAQFVTQATRNPLWAFLDAVTNSQYGSGHSLSKVDFNAIVDQAAAADTRGDKFDYSFSAAVAVPEAFDTILTVARSRHYWLGDTISVVRDEWRDVPSMLLTDREIVRDSTQVGWTMLGTEDPDAVVVEYIDEDTWRPASVQYPPDTEVFTATKPETKRLNGIVNREHAYREAAFYYLQSIYRRENIQIGVEYEGRAITFGQTLRIQSELPQAYGQAGAVTANDSGTLTLDPAPVWTADATFIRLRRANGTYFGPVAVTKGDTDAEAVLDADDLSTVETQQGVTLANVLARDDGGEWPSYDLGTADNQSRIVKVLSGQPNGPHCTLSLVLDDERVHATDLGDPPVLPVAQFPANSEVPIIPLLNVSFTQGIAEPTLRASWLPAGGAFYYIAEVSYDGGETWMQVYEGVDNKFEKVVTLGALKLRVQAIGNMRGPYKTEDVEAPTIEIAPNTVAYNSLNEAIKAQITSVIDDRFTEANQKIALLGSLVSQALSRTSLDKKIVKSDLNAVAGGAKASIEEVRTVAVDAQTAVADLSTAVAAEFDEVTASVLENSSAIATLDGYAAARWSVAIDVNGNVIGLVLINDSDNVSTFTVTADTFQVAFPGETGGTAVPVFTIDNVDGVAKLALRGDMIIDGSILTQMIAAGAITSVTIEAGAINTAQLAVNSVDINALIAGAASNIDAFTTTTLIGPVVETSVGSKSVNIQAGTAIVWYCLPPPNDIQDYSLRLYVDGSPKSLNTWSAASGADPLDMPMIAMEYITGLSAGNHTFDLRGKGKILPAGTVAIFNPRR